MLFVSLVTLTPLSADRAVAQGACTESLQAQIDAAPPSSVVLAPPCVYREDVTIDKPLTLEGGGETEIRGSDVWEASRFSARADGTWVAPGYPEVATNDSECEPGTSRCRWPEQVYYDGQPLTQVDPSSTPEGMQFAVDSDRDLVVGADPSGRLVEVTVRDSWLTGKRGAKGVVIRGFTMKHSTDAGVWNGLQPNWTIEDSDLSWAHTANLRLTQAPGLVANSIHSHHGGQAGMWGTGSIGLRVSGGEYDHNNTEEYLATHSSAGIKISAAEGTVFDGVEAHHNTGNGLWFDVPNLAQSASNPMTMSNNRVHHNERHGIKCEVSLYCDIHGNVVYENGLGQDGAGITVHGSSWARVYDNVVAWNRAGVKIGNPLRSVNHPNEAYYDRVRGIGVYGNKIFQERGPNRYALSWTKGYPGGNIYSKAAGNRGRDNSYFLSTSGEPHGLPFRWRYELKRLTDFNRTYGEERGRYLTDAEKNNMLAARGIPTNPE